MLKSTKTIFQRIISILLICVFAVSITPTTFLHDLFFAHKDFDVEHNHTHTNEVAKAGVNCHFNSFVCQPNLLLVFAPIKVDLPDNTTGFLINRNTHFYSQHHFYAELRGPPTCLLTIACLA